MEENELHEFRRSQAMWFAWGAEEYGKFGADAMAFGKAYADMYADHDAGHSQWMPSVMGAFTLWLANNRAIPTVCGEQTVEYTGAANSEFAMRLVKSG